MLLDENHVSFLTGHGLGRLATVAPDGGPQNKPVGYRYNADLETIDIGGFAMERSAKYRNIAANPQVSFVVDDSVGPGAEGTRFLEVRGRAEQVPAGPDGGMTRTGSPARVALSVTLPSQCIHAPTGQRERDHDERRGSGTR
jgi:PPOX class F420-dependent enzyme/OxyR family protein